MFPCPHCACHVRTAAGCCPHCGGRLFSPRTPSVAAGLLALGLLGCVGATPKDSASGETGTTITAEPEYGVTTTDYADADTDADTDTDVDTDADTDRSGDTGVTTGVDYGSPP